MPKPRVITTSVMLASAITVMANTAFAHHGMDGKVPSSLFQGLISGLLHPVIGLDHLAMVLLVGAFCGAFRQGFAPVATFVGASLVGCFVHVARLDLPHAEKVLAASVLLAGLAACAATRAPRLITILLFGACGILHGYAYGESIVGAEATPLVAYLVGFSLIQLTLAAAAFRGATVLAARPSGRQLAFVRILGAASMAVGLLALR
jgi:urease accessory protein